MWEPSQHPDYALNNSSVNRWNELIGGIRWYRWKADDKKTYFTFVVEDEGTVKSLTQLDLDNDYAYPEDFHEAFWWESSSNFPPTDTFWRGELAAEPRPAQPQPAQESSPTVVPPAPAVAGRRLNDPTLSSARDPEYTRTGSYAWPVKMTIRDVQNERSWIIQKVELTDSETNATFWEAFPVEVNQANARHEDIFQSIHNVDKGKVKVKGLMQHYVFAGGAEPPGMTPGGSNLSDDEQISSDTRPPFWTDGGAVHNFDFTWGGAFGIKITTVPAYTGKAVEKEHHSQLGAG
jgi:hypothetical protein